MNYYNEFDPSAAAWLRELIAQGLIPAGHVDERSITEISPLELSKYTQCHFFAGIGGWPLALKLAGWPADIPVWTGSCPCQPYSAAGQGKGTADERHLWPVFRDLITFGEPTVTFGEQVASKAGREWLAGIRADLEGLGYAVGAADLCAASAGAPHIRQRLFWVADANRDGQRATSGRKLHDAKHHPEPRREPSRLADAGHKPAGRSAAPGQAEGGRAFGEFTGCCVADRMGNPHLSGRGEQCGPVAVSPEFPPAELRGNAWDRYDLLPCTDGKARRVESGTFPLAHGIPGRVGLLRGYGNAIVPQVAAQFIQAFLES
jgi:DNA (cytosine-5)-methyltransferase 1